jgi:predicted metalloprotease with PDZ domain
MSRLAPFNDAATSIDSTNFNNIFISYYTYGEALALGIDLAIRQRFPGKSLDDWMRTMWREHPDIDRPYTLEDLEHTLAETTSDDQFAHEIFERHITGLQPLDFAGLLSAAGLKLQKAHPDKAWLGVERLESSPDGVKITSNTLRGSPLYGTGLDRGDEIVKCAGKPVKTPMDLDACLEKQKPGGELKLAVNTRTGEKKLKILLTEDPSLEVVTYEKAGLPVMPEMKVFREAWLRSKAVHRP